MNRRVYVERLISTFEFSNLSLPLNSLSIHGACKDNPLIGITAVTICQDKARCHAC
eukprot:m.152593 g.152593  ORF g.152593 m.152593 type:complete len:56 (-) comp16362_c1_seq1:2069-2236(-)